MSAASTPLAMELRINALLQEMTLDEQAIGRPEHQFGLVSADTIAPGDALTVTVEVTNTGKRAGQEVVQLYMHDPDTHLPRPEKELKGFVKIALEPGRKLEPAGGGQLMPVLVTRYRWLVLSPLPAGVS